MKKCSKCGIEKEYTEYNKDKRSKDAHKSQCRSCDSVYYKRNSVFIKKRVSKYREVNKKNIKVYSKKYQEENREKLKEYRHNYYVENKEGILERGKEYRKDNKEIISIRNKKYREDNIEKIRDRRKEYYNGNKDMILTRNKDYRDSFKSDITSVYLIPSCDYVGVTNNLKQRMSIHRSVHKRDTDNYRVLVEFDNREDAFELEDFLHELGYKGGKIHRKEE